MEFWQTLLVTIAPAVASAILGYLTGQLSKKAKANNSVGDGVKELLRDKIMYYHDKYCEIGEISSIAYQNLEEMYKTYHELGGNGFITKEYEECKKLRIK